MSRIGLVALASSLASSDFNIFCWLGNEKAYVYWCQPLQWYYCTIILSHNFRAIVIYGSKIFSRYMNFLFIVRFFMCSFGEDCFEQFPANITISAYKSRCFILYTIIYCKYKLGAYKNYIVVINYSCSR